jgi:hypothetical protein
MNTTKELEKSYINSTTKTLSYLNNRGLKKADLHTPSKAASFLSLSLPWK